MRYISVCSGIEAATVAWHPLRWELAAFAEIEKFPSAVLAHHYPAVPNHGDFNTIQGDEHGAVDLLVGGTPCQDFSVAGLRAGMDGKRGQLTVEFARLAGRLRPRWLVWENVPGVLSIDGGRAFGTFLGLLGELGYGVAYRVLDAQHFGVPQRRRRVFVVGHLGDWRRAAAVLFERHSLSGHPAPRRQAGKGFTHSVAPSLTGSGRGVERGGDSRGQDPVVAVGIGGSDIGYALRSEASHSGDKGDGGVNCTLVAQPVCMATGQGSAEIGIGIGTTLNCNHEAPIVTHALRAEGFDASEDSTGRGTPLVPIAIQGAGTRENSASGLNGVGVREDGIAYTLEAKSEVQAVAFAQNSRDEVRLQGGDGQVVGALAAEPGMKQTTYFAIQNATRGKNQNGLGISDNGSAYTLDQGSQHGVAIGLDSELNAMEDGSGPLKALSPIGGGVKAMASVGMAVRRLTPRECERLQGFPDDYTKISDKTADGPRYKALGNSMAVPVMRWIGERIALMEKVMA